VKDTSKKYPGKTRRERRCFRILQWVGVSRSEMTHVKPLRFRGRILTKILLNPATRLVNDVLCHLSQREYQVSSPYELKASIVSTNPANYPYLHRTTTTSQRQTSELQNALFLNRSSINAPYLHPLKVWAPMKTMHPFWTRQTKILVAAKRQRNPRPIK
jgi:hypothetical protein